MVVETPNFERGDTHAEAGGVSEFQVFKQESESIKEDLNVEESAKIVEQRIVEQSIHTDIEHSK